MARTTKKKFVCFNCGNEYVETNFYKSNSVFYESTGKIPYCKQCIEKLYLSYFDRYTNEGCLTPERKAVKRLCMAFDIYFVESAFQIARKEIEEDKKNISYIASYMKAIQLNQYRNKKQTYDTTIYEEDKKEFVENTSLISSENSKVDDKVKEFFGRGFNDDDYIYLKKEYDDWVTRHECNTKSQEEVFKRLCFKQLEILKATRMGEDTKNLDDTFLKQLEAAKLQPKQSKGDTTAETQTFGTLIDKWENTRPLPEIEEELKDVDKIGYLIQVFFTGHMSKVLDIPSGLASMYDKYMEKYTVKKKERSNDSDNEALYDKIFGKKNIDE